jgi:hypothetical protein
MLQSKTIPGSPRGAKGFFAWLGRAQPQIARSVLIKLQRPAMLGDLGLTAPEQVVTEEKPVSPTFTDKIRDLVLGASQAYLTYSQMQAQKKVMDMQLKRAQAGLAPLDINMEQYGLTGPAMNVGLSPATRNLLMWGGGALAAVYLLPKLLKR